MARRWPYRQARRRLSLRRGRYADRAVGERRSSRCCHATASITRGSAAGASRLIGSGIRSQPESRERKPHSTPKSEETMSQAVSTLLLRNLQDRKSTRLNSSHLVISYAVFCLKKKKTIDRWHA